MKRKNNRVKSPRASVLAFSLIIMGVMIIVALGIAFSSLQSRKSSIGSSKSTVAFQNADSGVEAVLQKIKENRDGKIVAIDPPTDLDGCNGILNSSSKYKVEMKKTDGSMVDCGDDVSDIDMVKSTGYHGQDSRAIEVDVPSASGCTGNGSPVQIASDNFNRPDEIPLAGDWSQSQNTEETNLISSQVTGNTSQWDRMSFRNAGTYCDDQYSQIEVRTTPPPGPPQPIGSYGPPDIGGVVLRWQANGSVYNGYEISIKAIRTIQIWVARGDAPTWERLPVGATIDLAKDIAVGDKLRAGITGNEITVYMNGFLVGSAIDTNNYVPTGGRPGFRQVNSSIWDNWEGGDF